jgi:hypothetical protein
MTVSNQSTSLPVEIQVQQTAGDWKQVFVIPNNSQRIITGMKEASKQYKGKRIRAVEMGSQRIIDIL